MGAAVASLAVVTIILRCVLLWRPETQLRLHQAHLRQAVEKRDWAKVEKLVDPAYSDRWGYSRATGIQEARQWLGQFFSLTITVNPVATRLAPDGGTVIEYWKLEGQGLEGATLAKDATDRVQTPFTFQWKHGSWKPWDWTLVHVDNPGLNLSAPDL